MASFKQRAVGALVGSVIADAAGMPVHWVYDPEKLNDEILKKREDPEFLEKNHSPFYTLPVGKPSFYGDQILATLEAVVEAKGWKKEEFSKKFQEKFGAGTAYDHEANKIDLNKKPIEAPWMTHVMKNFLAASKGDGKIYSDSPMNDSEIQATPLVAFYAGKEELKQHLEEMSRTTQDSDVAAEIGVTTGLLLEHLMQAEGDVTLETAIEKILPKVKDDSKTWFKEVKEEKEKKTAVVEAATKFGRACGVPGNFKTGVYIALGAGDDFKKAVRESIRAAGDTCGRSAFVGALMGARLGIDALPKDWITKAEIATKVQELAEKLIELRG